MPKHTYTPQEVVDLEDQANANMGIIERYNAQAPEYEVAAWRLHKVALELSIAAGQARRKRTRAADRAERKAARNANT